MVVAPETTAAFKCEGCGRVFHPDDAGPPIYSCGCGETFIGHEGHRCPSCNKFASKENDESCPDECTDGVEEITAIVDPVTEELHEDEAAYAQAIEDRKPENVAAKKKQDVETKARMEAEHARYNVKRDAMWARRQVMFETVVEAITKFVPEGAEWANGRRVYVEHGFGGGKVRNHGESFGNMAWEEAYIIFSHALGREPDPAVLEPSEIEREED